MSPFWADALTDLSTLLNQLAVLVAYPRISCSLHSSCYQALMPLEAHAHVQVGH